MPTEAIAIYLESIVSARLTPTDERALAVRIAAGDTDARQHLITANLQLVPGRAAFFIGRGLEYDDLLQEGNLGLMRATLSFDPDKGRFSTHATWWIDQAIRRGIHNQSRAIRLPVHLAEKLAQIDRLGSEDIAEVARQIGKSEAHVRYALSKRRHTFSLDRPYGAGDDTYTLSDVLSAPQIDPVESIARDQVTQALTEALSRLDARAADIMRYRFGLVDGIQHTLDECGARHGITRERARQIEWESKRRLRDRLHDVYTEVG